MVERSELITVCRQMGGMMEAGVDILRITRVLRAQTNNPRLLQLYDQLDHDLTMGRSLADAMERAPDVFSLFIVSLVQQARRATTWRAPSSALPIICKRKANSKPPKPKRQPHVPLSTRKAKPRRVPRR
jgi:hypothetical protein